MTESSTDFFNQLAQRGHEPLLEKVTGTMRFDLAHGEHLDHILVTVRKGHVTISNQNVEADLVVRSDRALFSRIAGGESNLLTAALRGEIAFQGDAQLLTQFQRLLPAPPSANARGDVAGRTRRKS